MSKSYTAAGKQIQCSHCDHGEFECQKVLMNTRGVTFFNLDWLNRAATALTCTKCGRVEWFKIEPSELG